MVQQCIQFGSEFRIILFPDPLSQYVHQFSYTKWKTCVPDVVHNCLCTARFWWLQSDSITQWHDLTLVQVCQDGDAWTNLLAAL